MHFNLIPIECLDTSIFGGEPFASPLLLDERGVTKPLRPMRISAERSSGSSVPSSSLFAFSLLRLLSLLSLLSLLRLLSLRLLIFYPKFNTIKVKVD